MLRLALQFTGKTCLMIIALLIVTTALADESKGPSPVPKKEKAAKDADSDADEQHRREAEATINNIEVEVFSDEQWTKIKRIEKPLLYYGDSTRENDRGSVWAWGEKGRPIAVIEIYQNVNNRDYWVYTICNTSGRKLRAKRGGEAWWQENDSASELKDIPGAPTPSPESAKRHLQMKLLAQKFTGHQFWDPNNSRFELRRLERPLHTYKDEAAGVLDGALFTLANGTNPEILLFVEARVDPNDKTKSAWQFTVGRLAHAELHLAYDGKEVFEAPRGNRLTGANKPYWLGFIPKVSEIERMP